MSKLILIRHGQSEWNKQNIFTGWIDIPLSLKGVEESFAAGKQIAELPVDVIYTSELIRGIMTAMLVMNVHGSGKVPVIVHPEKKGFEGWQKCHSEKTQESLVPVYCAWELNERMYGKLQGMNKDEMRAQFGAEQVQTWRRSFAEAPPEGESLKMTSERTLPYFRQTILPQLKKGKNVIVAAHGNSLRSIVMDLEQLSGEQVIQLEIATGKPLIYDYTSERFTRVK